jgi:hypothetical protein
MARHDWLAVGLKLIGVYFGVNGVIALGNLVMGLLVAASVGNRAAPVSVMLVNLLQPAVYLVAAYFLVLRTPDCVFWCDRESSPTATNAPIAP